MVSMSAQIVLWACLALCTYAYFVYPVCLWLAVRLFSKPPPHPKSRRPGCRRSPCCGCSQ